MARNVRELSLNLQEASEEVIDDLLLEFRTNPMHPRDTGELQDSWVKTEDGISNPTPYGPIVEYGLYPIQSERIVSNKFFVQRIAAEFAREFGRKTIRNR